MATEERKNKTEALPLLDLNATPLEEPEEGVFATYSNVVNMDWTLYDVRLRFAELVQVVNDDLPTWNNQHSIMLEKAFITLPWHQAKNLRNMLNTVVSNYEDVNGELKPIKLASTREPKVSD
jgi:hypothetical protein